LNIVLVELLSQTQYSRLTKNRVEMGAGTSNESGTKSTPTSTQIDVCFLANSRIITSDDFKRAKYFSPKTLQKHAFPNQEEGWVCGEKGEEKRTLVSPLTHGTFQSTQGQLCTIKDNESFVGSGTVCLLGSSFKDGYFLLTCAHNFVTINKGLETTIVKANSALYNYMQDGRKNCLIQAKVTSFHIHPMYHDHWELHEGYDIAIAKLDGDFNRAPPSQNSYWSDIESEGAKEGEEICVIGYPGEKDGFLYMMKGTIYEIRSLDSNRKIILYNDINTTPGQSGSPVYLKRGAKWARIGVHVGYDPSVKCNVATGITKEMKSWICNSVRLL